MKIPSYPRAPERSTVAFPAAKCPEPPRPLGASRGRRGKGASASVSDPISSLANAIAAIPSAARARLDKHGFQEARLLELGDRLRRGEDDRGLATGRIEPPGADDVVALPPTGSDERRRLEDLGAKALSGGNVALVSL